jgi:hypothetical protein
VTDPTDALHAKIAELKVQLFELQNSYDRVHDENMVIRPQLASLVHQNAILKHELDTYKAIEPRPSTERISSMDH